jgi:hypothetical protein
MLPDGAQLGCASRQHQDDLTAAHGAPALLVTIVAITTSPKNAAR